MLVKHIIDLKKNPVDFLTYDISPGWGHYHALIIHRDRYTKHYIDDIMNELQNSARDVLTRAHSYANLFEPIYSTINYRSKNDDSDDDMTIIVSLPKFDKYGEVDPNEVHVSYIPEQEWRRRLKATEVVDIQHHPELSWKSFVEYVKEH